MSTNILARLVIRFEELEEQLNALDAAVGDGDHGATMLKGLRAAAAASDRPGKAFRRASGGAAGTLFSLLIDAVAVVDRLQATDAASVDALAAELDRAARRIAEMGQAGAGDKTMLDALLPAALAAQQHTSVGPQPAAMQTALQAASQAAAIGAKLTCEMAARRGRARYVENAGVGHMDAGARSVAEILSVLCSSTTSAKDE